MFGSVWQWFYIMFDNICLLYFTLFVLCFNMCGCFCFILLCSIMFVYVILVSQRFYYIWQIFIMFHYVWQICSKAFIIEVESMFIPDGTEKICHFYGHKCVNTDYLLNQIRTDFIFENTHDQKYIYLRCDILWFFPVCNYFTNRHFLMIKVENNLVL